MAEVAFWCRFRCESTTDDNFWKLMITMNRFQNLVGNLLSKVGKILNKWLLVETALTGPQINWRNFSVKQVFNWCGKTALYNGRLKQTDVFQSQRKLSFGEKEAFVAPMTSYPFCMPVVSYKDIDRSIILVEEQSSYSTLCNGHFWSLSYLCNNFADGVFHPKWKNRRGFFLANGISTWCPLALGECNFGLELSICFEHLRISVDLQFDMSGYLDEVAFTRESIAGSRELFWSDQIRPAQHESPIREYVGQMQTVDQCLNFSDYQLLLCPAAEWQRDASSYRVIDLPDGVKLRLPIQLFSSDEISIEILWASSINDMAVSYVKLTYSATGVFNTLAGGHFTPVFTDLMSV